MRRYAGHVAARGDNDYKTSATLPAVDVRLGRVDVREPATEHSGDELAHVLGGVGDAFDETPELARLDRLDLDLRGRGHRAAVKHAPDLPEAQVEIGRASCRERV